MSVTRTAALSVVLAATTFAGVSPASAAPDPDRGLFGIQDPTYDGVYRQGLAITGLVAADRRVPRSAVSWLLRQQCADGSFVSYRPDTTLPCPAPDPTNYTGPDSNSTAIGAMALRATGDKAHARSALRYLRKMQNDDGGFPYYRGGSSDTNSTGLALAALNGSRATKSVLAQVKDATRYLGSVQFRCQGAASDRGMMSYQQAPLTANTLATAQAALGMVTTLPSTPRPTRVSGVRCVGSLSTRPVSPAGAALAALRRQLADGLLPSAFGSDGDASATAQAIISLKAAGVRGRDLRPAVRALRRVAATYTVAGGSTDAGAVGTLILAATATGSDPRDFGGVDLIAARRASRR
ncbi:MAG: prenyltransferase/squalene oxidase repeat-containing protein [Candidatus Nanopelagicales bacterium]